MENPDSRDATSKHPIYGAGTASIEEISREDAWRIKKAIECLYPPKKDYNWYLEWYNKNSDTDQFGTLVDEVLLRDLTDNQVRKWLCIDEDEDACAVFEITNKDLAREIQDNYCGYRYIEGKFIPQPFLIDLVRYDYWLRSSET